MIVVVVQIEFSFIESLKNVLLLLYNSLIIPLVFLYLLLLDFFTRLIKKPSIL